MPTLWVQAMMKLAARKPRPPLTHAEEPQDRFTAYTACAGDDGAGGERKKSRIHHKILRTLVEADYRRSL